MSEASSPVGNLVAAALVDIGPVRFLGKSFGFASVSAPLSGVFELLFGPDNHIALDSRVVIVTPVVSAPPASILVAVDTIGGGSFETGLMVSTFDAVGDPEGNSFYVLVFRKSVGGG